MNATAFWKDLTIEANIESKITVAESIENRTEIQISWNEMTEQKPQLTIGWSIPIIDFQFYWYPSCGTRRALRVDWFGPMKSRISSSAPVYTFYNTSGRNRFTMALSDVLTEINTRLGVHEEDGTLKCEVVIPLDATGLTSEYSVTLYRDYDDVSFAESIRRVSRWWEIDCGLTPMPVPDEARLPLYSAWYSFHQATIAHEIEAECERATKLGMKTIIVDDGWQTADGQRGYGYCGDWEPTPEKIPDMAAHVKKVHDTGMKYMLWYGMSLIGKYSKKWEEFKGMVTNPDTENNHCILDPRYPVIREYLINVLVTALKEWDLDGFKLDFVDSFPASTYAPAPTPEMDYIKVEDAVVRLMTDVMNALKAIKPEILIEFRQSYIGPAMRTYGNMFRVADCPNDPISNRVGIVDLRLLSGNTAVHSDMLMWHKDDTVEAAARQVLSVLFGVMQVSVKLDEIQEDHLKMVTFWCNFMTKHRELLSAPLEVDSPENLYPVVRSRLNGEEAVAVYDQHVVSLSDAETLYLFNATDDSYLILRAESPRALTVQTFNCMGEAAGEYTLPAARLHEISIPVSGFAVIR